MITNLILHNLPSVTEKTVLSGIVVIMEREINKANPRATVVIFIVIIFYCWGERAACGVGGTIARKLNPKMFDVLHNGIELEYSKSIISKEM